MQTLITSIMEYERHVAIFTALHSVHDKRTPWNVNPKWGYPTNFEIQIDERVKQLEDQRRGLTNHWF